ncbi:DUF222 domain-containing protein [Arthrobacter dokdonensis]|uniref:DUF222 domain-containing protein n=1 Tax=Arthrobacter dokdonellae TaxID=2211210 RepID=UPI000DE5A236|nr:DUF222 domain-containing protein [Arthrobacter dokdonellae]
MDRPESGPGSGGVPATADVAALIAAVSLPSIEPFGPDTPGLAGLPAYTRHPVPEPEPASRVQVARTVQDATIAALAAVRVLEGRTAALKAALLARHLAAAAVESAAVALDPWQAGLGEASATAEIATTLCIAQGSAAALARQAVELLAHHPETLTALETGTLSWRHACTVLGETGTLAQTPSLAPADITAFEARLLAAAPGTTAGGFASRARRMREGLHPETLTTRTRQAIAKRSLTLEPGKDGMSWLTLHIPAPAAQGAYVQCTRLARTQQGPDEHRTPGQLQADTATLLLLNQPLPTTTNEGTTNTTGGSNAGTNGGTTGGLSDSDSNAGTTRGTTAGLSNSDNRTTGADSDRSNGGSSSTGGSNGNTRHDGPGGNNAGGAAGAPDGSHTVAGGRNGGPVGGPYVGARFISDPFSGQILDMYTITSPTPMEEGRYTGLTLVDVVPDWAHGPSHEVIGPLTRDADARARAWETNPENIPLTGTLCPDTPPGTGSTGTASGTGSTVGGSVMRDGHARGDGSVPGGGTNGATNGGTGGGSGVTGGMIGELVAGLAGALVDGVVDGLLEDPVQDYLDQLEAARNGAAITGPPLPGAQVIITVPVLGLLGATNEPAQLAGHGPIPEETARRLLENAGAFLRVLTDPVTNVPLAELAPERYRLREAEKTLLRALNETCSFPNCTNPAITADIDHVIAYGQGGPTTRANTHPGCRLHHALRHFRDDKDRHGRYRQDRDPDRAGIKLRGWKPCTTADGRVGWTSPTGKYHAPTPRDTQPPAYPKWLKKRLAKNPSHHKNSPTTGPAPRIDLSQSPLESLLDYNFKHPNNNNPPDS